MLKTRNSVRNRLPNALQTYTSLPAHYAPHGWTSLEAFMLTRSLDLHATSDKPKDKDWVNVSLEYLKAYVQDMGKVLLIATEDHVAYTESVVKALRQAAEELDAGKSDLERTLPSSTAHNMFLPNRAHAPRAPCFRRFNTKRCHQSG